MELYKKEFRKNKSTRNIPLQRLEDEDVRAFLMKGWRVSSKSRGIHVVV